MLSKIFKTICFVLLTHGLIWAVTARLYGQELALKGGATIHTTSKDGAIRNQSVTIEILQKLISQAELNMRRKVANSEKATGATFVPDRIVLSDACMGADQYEHDQLSQGAIICLLGITKDSSELPFSKAYFEKPDGTGFELLHIATLPAKLIGSLKTDGTFGRTIWAAAYWVPLVRKMEGKLLVDFMTNRTRFTPGVSFPFSKSFGKGLKDSESKNLTINFGTMKEVVEREYPGMEMTQEILDQIEKLRTQ